MAKFLRDMLSDAKSQVRGVTTSVGNEVTGGVRGAVRNVTNDIKTAGVGVVNDTFRAAVGSMVGAVSAPFEGTVIGDFIGEAFGSFLPSEYSIGSADLSSSDHELGQALQMADPAMSFLWSVDMPQIGSGSTRMLPPIYVEEATLPTRTFQERSIFREGKERHYASMYSLDNLRLVIYKDMANVTINYLLAWQEAMLTKTTYAIGSGDSGPNDPNLRAGKFLPPSSYKKDIVFFLLSPQRQVITEFIYRGCWPTNIGTLSLNSQSDRLKYEIDFQVDDVFINVGDLSETTIKDFMFQRRSLREQIQGVGADISKQVRNTISGGFSSISVPSGTFIPSF